MTTEQRFKARQLALSGRSVLLLFLSLIFSFFAGRVTIAGELLPFGSALLICCFTDKGILNPFAAVIGAYAALLTSADNLIFPQYYFCLISILSAVLIVSVLLRLRRPLTLSVIAACAAHILSAAIFKSSVLLSFAYSAGELIISLLSSRIFQKGFELFSRGRRRTVLNESELLSLAFVGVIGLAGIGKLNIADVHIISILSCSIALFAAYCGGSAVGAAVSAFSAFACLLAGIPVEFAVILVLSSAVAGLFGRVVRPVYCGLFFSAAAMFSALTGFTLTMLIEYAMGCILFCFMPQICVDAASPYLSSMFMKKAEFSLMQRRFQELTTGEIKKISKALCGAARSLKASAELRKRSGIQYALANIPEQCCHDCENYDTCWDKQFDISYAFLKNMYDRFRLAGKLTEKDITRSYESRCCKQKRLVFTLNSVFNEYTIKARWENKVMESRSVLSEQLKGVSSALFQLEERILQNMDVKDEAEDELRIALDKLGISVSDVSVMDKNGETYVDLRIKNCKKQGVCKKSIRSAVSSACGCNMRLAKEPVCGTGSCHLSYAPAGDIALRTAVSRATKDGSAVSGDTYALKPLPDGRFMMLICDGMGSGKRAQQESFAAADLIEDYYAAGFDSGHILSMINKLMLLSGSDEVFSALDLCIVDLNSADAKFTKIGAPHSYLIRQDKVTRLSAGALPLGIIEDCEPREHSCRLMAGDLIILFSDGISEAELRDASLYSKITAASPSDSVKLIADRILSAAIASYGGKAADDMTVIVARVTAA